MPTAACGINCDVCGLNTLGVCGTCGSGTSPEGRAKMQVQEKLFGHPCPILACANMNQLEYCMRDCPAFPCENFETQGYPFSRGYLDMQRRRRREAADNPRPRLPGAGSRTVVPKEHWDNLQKKDPEEVCRRALARLDPGGAIRLRVLDTDILVNPARRTMQAELKTGETVPVRDSLLQLITLVYLLQVTPAPLRLEKVGIPGLRSAHFFQGPHELNLEPLLEQYGRDAGRFKTIACSLGGRAVSGAADAEVVFSPFPKVLLYYLLWQGDEEFTPRLTVLFDRSIEDHFAADFIWALVRFVTQVLVAPGPPFHSPTPGPQM